MGDLTSAAVVNTAKKIYYVLKNRMYGFYSLSNPCFHGEDRSKATQFISIEKLLEKYGNNAIFGTKTYSSGLDIVRVEETAGVPSRRVATCSETPTGYVIKDSFSYSSNPDGGLGEGWVSSLNKAVVFPSEATAIKALTRRSMRLGLSYPCTIVRIIDVPATPVITETVLA